MEQSITIVALALSIAGISYLKVEQLDRMAMAQEAAAAQAVQDSIATAEAAIEAAKVRFVVIHDSEPGTNEVDLVLDGSASRDTESDSSHSIGNSWRGRASNSPTRIREAPPSPPVQANTPSV